MSPPGWFANKGRPPVFYRLDENDPCPPDMIHADQADTARIWPRLRNGRQPQQTWPVIGRPLPTRWTLTGDLFDITHWRHA